MKFVETVLANPVNAELMRRLASLRLNDCYLTAGCLFQTVWNHLSGAPLSMSIKDYDVFYFDDSDLSWEAENRVIQAVNELTADFGVIVEVKNQARVHLWYHNRFGAPYPRLTSSRDGIDRYLVTCTCVGIDVANLELYAPNGLDELYNGLLRRNPLNDNQSRFHEKANDYKARWPWLRVVPDAEA